MGWALFQVLYVQTWRIIATLWNRYCHVRFVEEENEAQRLKFLVQSHTARTWWSWNLIPTSLTPESMI